MTRIQLNFFLGLIVAVGEKERKPPVRVSRGPSHSLSRSAHPNPSTTWAAQPRLLLTGPIGPRSWAEYAKPLGSFVVFVSLLACRCWTPRLRPRRRRCLPPLSPAFGVQSGSGAPCLLFLSVPFNGLLRSACWFVT